MKKSLILLALGALALTGCSFGPKKTSSSSASSSSTSQSHHHSQEPVSEDSVLFHSMELEENIQEIPTYAELVGLDGSGEETYSAHERGAHDIHDITEPYADYLANPRYFNTSDGWMYKYIDARIEQVKSNTRSIMYLIRTFDTWLKNGDHWFYYLSYDSVNDVILLKDLVLSDQPWTIDGVECNWGAETYTSSTYDSQGKKVINSVTTSFNIFYDGTIQRTATTAFYYHEDVSWKGFLTMHNNDEYGEHLLEKSFIGVDLTKEDIEVVRLSNFSWQQEFGSDLDIVSGSVQNISDDLISVYSINEESVHSSIYSRDGATFVSGFNVNQFDINIYQLKGYDKIEYEEDETGIYGNGALRLYVGDQVFGAYEEHEYGDFKWQLQITPPSVVAEYLDILLHITNEGLNYGDDIISQLTDVLNSIGLSPRDDELFADAIDEMVAGKTIVDEKEAYGKTGYKTVTVSEFNGIWSVDNLEEITIDTFVNHCNVDKIDVREQETDNYPYGYTEVEGSGEFTIDEEHKTLNIPATKFTVKKSAFLDTEAEFRGVVALKSATSTTIIGSSDIYHFDGVNDFVIEMPALSIDIRTIDLNLDEYQLVMYVQSAANVVVTRISDEIALEYIGEDIDLELSFSQDLETIRVEEDGEYVEKQVFARTTYKCNIYKNETGSYLKQHQEFSYVDVAIR